MVEEQLEVSLIQGSKTHAVAKHRDQALNVTSLRLISQRLSIKCVLKFLK